MGDCTATLKEMLEDFYSGLELKSEISLSYSKDSNWSSGPEYAESQEELVTETMDYEEDNSGAINVSSFEKLLCPPIKSEHKNADMHFDTSEPPPSIAEKNSDHSCDWTNTVNESKFKLIRFIMVSLDAEKSSSFYRIDYEINNVVQRDPEFILKVALFARRVLNLRYSSNYVLAYAARNRACHPYLSKYFSAIICLPSDWLKLIEIYMTTTRQRTLPRVLRNVLVEKFQEFDQYQLAKYDKVTSIKSMGIKLSLKKMIRLLHISQPVESVMCLLGKKYPNNCTDFIHSGLPGAWDPDMAGVRMRLPIPATWETQLSAVPKAEQATVWVELIQTGKLPYMAALRNLANILLAGVPSQYIKKLVQKLTKKEEVENSKQLPFRFLSAYKMLTELEVQKAKALEDKDEVVDAPPQRKKGSASVADRLKKAALERRAKERKPRLIGIDDTELKRLKDCVQDAFNSAVQLNLPPVTGSTLIIAVWDEGEESFRKWLLLTMMCMSKCEDYDAYIIRGDEVYVAKEFRRLMPSNRSHFSVFRVLQWDKPIVCKDLQPVGNSAGPHKLSELLSLVPIHKKYTSMVALGRHMSKVEDLHHLILRYGNANVNAISVASEDYDNGKWVTIGNYTESVIQVLAGLSNGEILKQVEAVDRNPALLRASAGIWRNPTLRVEPELRATPHETVWASGVTAVQVFVSSTFQDMYGERDLISGLVFPALRRQLSQLEFPVLINEIDLRWGVPEEFSQSEGCLRICLEKVVTSDYLILLLGERYGWMPSEDLIEKLPPKLLKEVKRVFKPGMSITEIEARLFLHLNSDNRRNMLCFIRDASSLNSLPAELKSAFLDAPQRQKLEKFKQFLKENGLVHLSAYPAAFTGVVSSVPVMGNLETLGSTLFDSLYKRILNHSRAQIKPEASKKEISSVPLAYFEALAASVSPRHLQQALKVFLVDLPRRCSQARAQRLSPAQVSHSAPPLSMTNTTSIGRDGGILCILGSHGSGKTTLASALAVAFSNPAWEPITRSPGSDIVTNSSSFLSLKTPKRRRQGTQTVPEAFQKSARVYVHLTMGACTSTTMHSGLRLCAVPQMTQMTRFLANWTEMLLSELSTSITTNKIDYLQPIKKKLEEAYKSSSNLVEYITVFHDLLRVLGESMHNTYVFIVDSVDHLVPQNLTWIPDVIPENVRFIFTLDRDSKTAKLLAGRNDSLNLRMCELSRDEKEAAIRCYFAQYGKVLSNSGFDSQLSQLLRKQGIGLPLYLKMACDELRLYANFSNLSKTIQNLPEHWPELVNHIVARASVACGENLVKTALACILCSRHPLQPSRLLGMLNLWLYLTSEKAAPHAVAFLRGCAAEEDRVDADDDDDEDIPKDDPSCHAVLTPMALNILLAQLQPLLVGVEEVDESVSGENEAESVGATRLYVSEGLRLCSIQVAQHVRRICFEADRGLGKLSATQRVGYVVSSRMRKKAAGELPPKLGSTPTELQTYRLLLCEHYDDFRDMVYYAFRAKKLHLAIDALSSMVYIRQKVLNDDLKGLLEEYIGFDADPESMAEWTSLVKEARKGRFSVMREFFLQSGDLVKSFPEHVSQTLLFNLPSDCDATLKRDLDRIVTSKCAFALSPCLSGVGAVVEARAPSMTWRSRMVTSPISLASDGGSLVACGDASGSITLFDLATNKELNTLYGHTNSVTAMTFITPSASSGMAGPTAPLLYSVSADMSACLWHLMPTGDGNNGLVGVRVAQFDNKHSRAITGCAWDPERCNLVTCGLDGWVHLCALQPSLNPDIASDCGGLYGIGFSLESFKRHHRSFDLQYVPLNAMVLAEDNIIVGCWNGTLVSLHCESERNKKVLMVGSEVGPHCGKYRDASFYNNWGKYRGLYAPIVSLAYSGREKSLVACADSVGKIALIDATELYCAAVLQVKSSLPSNCNLHFMQDPITGDLLLASTGYTDFTHGAITVINVERAKGKDCVLANQTPDSSARIGSWCESLEAMIFGDNSGRVRCVDLAGQEMTAELNLTTAASRARVQALDLVQHNYNDTIVALGTSCGDVTVTKLNWKKWADAPFSVWPHAYGENPNGGGQNGGTLAVAVSPSAKFVVSGGGNNRFFVHFFDTSEFKEFDTSRTVCFNSHRAAITAVACNREVAFSGGKDGDLVAYVVEEDGDSNNTRILAVIPRAHEDWITALRVCTGNSSLHVQVISGSNDGTISVWLAYIGDSEDEDPFQCIFSNSTAHNTPVTHISFEDCFAVAASSDGVLSVWEMRRFTQRKLRTIRLPETKNSDAVVMLRYRNGHTAPFRDSPRAEKSHGTEDVINYDELTYEYAQESRVCVAYVRSDESVVLAELNPFENKVQQVCSGHPGVEAIQLTKGTVERDNKTFLVSAGVSITSDCGEIRLWPIEATDALPTPMVRGKVSALVTGGDLLFVGGSAGGLEVWNIADCRRATVNTPLLPPDAPILDLITEVTSNGEINMAAVLPDRIYWNCYTQSYNDNSTYHFYPSEFKFDALSIGKMKRPTRTFTVGARSGGVYEVAEVGNSSSKELWKSHAATQVAITNEGSDIIALAESRIWVINESYRDGFLVANAVTTFQVTRDQQNSIRILAAQEWDKFEFVRIFKLDSEMTHEYKLPAGVKITALREVSMKVEGENLILVAGSDGILRFLLRQLDRNVLWQVDYLPTGKIITKICDLGNRRIALGFINGEVKLYKFIDHENH